MKRRSFLERVGQLGAASLSLALPAHAEVQKSRPAAPQNLRLPGGDKKLLEPSDLKYLGAFAVPAISGYESGWTSGLTHRRIAGELRLYFSQMKALGQDQPFHLLETGAPPVPRTVPPYDPPAVVYGDMGATQGEVPTDGAVAAIHWDEQDRRLYWVAYNTYGGDPEAATLGYNVLSNPAFGERSTLQTMGIWRVSDATAMGFGTRWHKTVISIPDWFASTYCHGRRLGLAGGGVESRVTVGPVSVGPALMAAFPIDLVRDALVPGQTVRVYKGGLVPMILHPFHTGFGPPYFARRGDTNYRTKMFPSWDPRDGVGYWINCDVLSGGICWIETPTKHGLIVIADMVQGGLDTTVAAMPAPTKRTFAVQNAGDLRAGDLILIWNGTHRPDYQNGIGNGAFDCTELGIAPHAPCRTPAAAGVGFGQEATVASVSGKLITLTEDLWEAPIVGGPVFAGEWYYNSGVPYTRKVPAWYMYDPKTLARTARGENTPDLTDWAWRHLPAYGLGEKWWTTDIRDVTFDTETNRLYLLNGGRVLVYEVA